MQDGDDIITLRGTLDEDGNLRLNEPIALPPGPVEVTIRLLEPHGPPDLVDADEARNEPVDDTPADRDAGEPTQPWEIDPP